MFGRRRIFGLAAALSAAFGDVMAAPSGGDAIGGTRNSGQRRSNRHIQRMARKRRNVARHRKACR